MNIEILKGEEAWYHIAVKAEDAEGIDAIIAATKKLNSELNGTDTAKDEG